MDHQMTKPMNIIRAAFKNAPSLSYKDFSQILWPHA